MNHSITVVFFDFDDTLVFRTPDSLDALSDVCAALGRPLDAAAKRRGRRAESLYFADPTIRDRYRQLSGDEFWFDLNRRLLAAMGVEADLDSLARRVTDQLSDLEQVHVCPEAVPVTLAALRDRGYALGLITNREGMDRLHALLETLGLRSLLGVIVAAGEVGARKPDPRIFQAALERAGVAAEEAIYVGDNYWADVVGAVAAGLTPVLLDPHGLFPEAECAVVERIDQLLDWLPRSGPGTVPPSGDGERG